MQEQLEMQVKVLNQELDVTEAQKINQLKVIEQLKGQNFKLKDSVSSLIDKVKQRKDIHKDMTKDMNCLE